MSNLPSWHEPALSEVDPEISVAHLARRATRGRHHPPHRQRELRLARGARGDGSVLTNKYSEGYPHKRYYEGQRSIDPVEELAMRSACKAALRRRPRQRAALLGQPRQPRGLPRVREAGRDHHGPRPAVGRPPDPRVDTSRSPGKYFKSVAVRRARERPPHRHGPGARARAASTARSSSGAAPRPIRARSTSPRSAPSPTRSAPSSPPTSRTSRGSSPAARTPRRWASPTWSRRPRTRPSAARAAA